MLKRTCCKYIFNHHYITIKICYLHIYYKLWIYDVSSPIFSSITNFGSEIYFGTTDHMLYCLELSTSKCNSKFKINLDAPIISTPCILMGKYIIVATKIGSIFLVDRASKEIINHLHLYGEVFSSPVCCDDKILIGCRDNNVYCIEIKNVISSSNVNYK